MNAPFILRLSIVSKPGPYCQRPRNLSPHKKQSGAQPTPSLADQFLMPVAASLLPDSPGG